MTLAVLTQSLVCNLYPQTDLGVAPVIHINNIAILPPGERVYSSTIITKQKVTGFLCVDYFNNH